MKEREHWVGNFPYVGEYKKQEITINVSEKSTSVWWLSIGNGEYKPMESQFQNVHSEVSQQTILNRHSRYWNWVAGE